MRRRIPKEVKLHGTVLGKDNPNRDLHNHSGCFLPVNTKAGFVKFSTSRVEKSLVDEYYILTRIATGLDHASRSAIFQIY